MENFWNLRVVQKAHSLVLNIYKLTSILPADEKFGLISQMRRASVSVTANIIEATKRKTIKDKRNFFVISAGSLEELKYYLVLCCDLKFIHQSEKEKLLVNCSEIGAMLSNLNKNLKY